jgi:uncharacterized protein (TIGR02246 family)
MADDTPRAALEAFDAAFASGDAEALAARFTPDARLLLLHAEAIEGRDAIRAHWARLFAQWETGAWRTEPLTLDVHGDHAYAIATYTETLVPRDPSLGHRRLVRGRLVRFLRRDDDGRWRVTLALNSHSRPVELVE